MVQLRHRTGLRRKAAAERLIGAEFPRQDLDRHFTVERHLPRMIHRAHSAAGDQRVDRIPGKQGCQFLWLRGGEWFGVDTHVM